MVDTPKKQPGDRPAPADTSNSTTDAAMLPTGGAVLGGKPQDADEPMTDKQAARLRQLCEKHDEAFDGNLTREQADARIEAMEKG